MDSQSFYGLNFLYNTNNRGTVDNDVIKLNTDLFFQQLLFNYINEEVIFSCWLINH